MAPKAETCTPTLVFQLVVAPDQGAVRLTWLFQVCATQLYWFYRCSWEGWVSQSITGKKRHGHGPKHNQKVFEQPRKVCQFESINIIRAQQLIIV